MNDLVEMKIEVTNKCSLACVHCSSMSSIDCNNSLDLFKCMSIVKQATELGLKKIAFSGGEPLLWGSIVELVEYSKSLGLNVSIYTTGNIEDIENKIQQLATVGLDNMIFSLYSDIEEEHIRITRKLSSFQNTLNAIGLANKAKINAEIHFVALASNYKKLIKVAELAKQLEIKRISVLRFVPQGRGRLISKDVMSHIQNLELKRIITQLRQNGYDIRTGSPFNVLLLNAYPKCMAAQDRLIVDSDLFLYPCDAFKQIKAENIVGTNDYSNLDKFNINECWEKSPYLNAVRAINSNENPTCKTCEIYGQCNSGCLAQKYITHKKLDYSRDPACLKQGR